MAAAGASSSSNSVMNSQSSSIINPPEPKEEQPQEVKNEKMETKEEVKSEQVEHSKDVKKEAMEEPICSMEEKARIEKFKRYEADFKQYIMSKYFSDKTIFGGNVFDTKTNIDGQSTTASRFPPYQSYVDPVKFAKMIGLERVSPSDTPNLSTSNNGKKPST